MEGVLDPTPPLHPLLPLAFRVRVVDDGAGPIDGDAPYAPLPAAGDADARG